MIWIKRTRSLGTALAAMLSVLAVCACGAATEGGSAAEGGRVVEHAMGKTEISGTPERVVVLDTGELDSAMSLGVEPVGSVEVVPGAGFPSYLDGTGGIETVGTIEEPDLEKIATLEPDLILSSKERHEQLYDQLSRIAPTVFTETPSEWQENFEVHATALGKSEEAGRIERGYARSIDRLRGAFGEKDWPEVSIVRFTPGDTRIYQKENFIGTVLEDVGLPRPPAQNVDAFGLLNLSAEAIPKMDGDAMFVTVYGNERDTAKEEITSNPLWQRLGAVRDGRVHEVSDDLWMLGLGYTAANGVVNDLEKNLAAK